VKSGIPSSFSGKGKTSLKGGSLRRKKLTKQRKNNNNKKKKRKTSFAKGNSLQRNETSYLKEVVLEGVR